MRLAYKRRREKKTNYRKRLKLLLSGKPRLVVRRKLNSIISQVVIYDEKGDRTIASANSLELKKFGWKAHPNNIPAAYLTGLLCGLRARNKINEAILDIGMHVPTKGSSLYACLKGFVDSGINVPFDKEVLPSEDRIRGKHISNYFKILKEKEMKNQFSMYKKSNFDVENFENHFEEVKKKIIDSFGVKNG
ncbi:MAG: 50S ribosomal protein L18 [Candidatus Parvarchaeota archaeon]|nr:50S ribosomal protein L18 [Candidatus Jingweiarchaeum tengchongense]MCW1297785.1 50S ribosomal protein L18 [Candidatus Jingweiarchaeum tengchongense]MCW1299795.1 50S ribosomal protein L18 [Candidatus Jingweiarchaeum tengchongense]MCW1304234.1 50S ribosomal protein L18 [Candidatus Jingweiarchaeum tengchongense]MCW1305262.1 50S ribosomal protein L18 [Candidatus Jingweiarchaeum tengchongense]